MQADRAQKPKRVHFLVTGFDPFGGHDQNPTQRLLEVLPQTQVVSLQDQNQAKGREFEIYLHKQLLPTSGKEAQKLLARTIKNILKEEKGPLHILMTGLAHKRDALSLERIALNLKDYRIADNQGRMAADRPVEGSAPLALRTHLDLVDIAAQLGKKRWPVEISNHAGTYICNEVYFRALYLQDLSKRIKSTLFVHTPDLPTLEAVCKAMGAAPDLGEKMESVDILKLFVQDLIAILAVN